MMRVLLIQQDAQCVADPVVAFNQRGLRFRACLTRVQVLFRCGNTKFRGAIIPAFNPRHCQLLTRYDANSA